MLRRFCPTVSTARATTALLQAVSSVQFQTADVHHHLERHDLQRFLGIKRSNKARANRNTHVNEKLFRKMRGRKTVLVDLPDDVEERRLESLSPSDMRIEMLKKGINPYKEVSPRIWQESQYTMQSFQHVFDPYVKPEQFPLSMSKESFEDIKTRSLSKWHNWKNGVNRIRKKEGMQKFDPKTFGPTAEEIYVQAHKALQERNKTSLHKLITENAYLKMWPDVEQGSIKWELVEWKEPSRVVTIRCSDNPYQSGNDIAQLTVRMHSVQKLAVYDRFGHLILGSETEPKEVVEYAVFENHIAVIDGIWRLHDKVHPKWSEKKQGTLVEYELEEKEAAPTAPTSLPLRAAKLQEEQKNMKQE